LLRTQAIQCTVLFGTDWRIASYTHMHRVLNHACVIQLNTPVADWCM